MRGDSQQEFFIVSPSEQQTACRETEDAVLLDSCMKREDLQFLPAIKKELCIASLSPEVLNIYGCERQWDKYGLTLAVSRSCSSSSLLEGFREQDTHVR